jgi:L-amino acid N-acyltransferase YncA
MHIRDAVANDAEAIGAIYNRYVQETSISFEQEPVSAADMAARIAAVQASGLPWIVFDDDAGLAGYAYASLWRARPAYRLSVETTIYLLPARAGAGLGSRLYAHLLERLRAHGCHLAIGGIALPNAASVALHERAGFTKVAHFSEVGFKFGRWVDVGYWQLKLTEDEAPTQAATDAMAD